MTTTHRPDPHRPPRERRRGRRRGRRGAARRRARSPPAPRCPVTTGPAPASPAPSSPSCTCPGAPRIAVLVGADLVEALAGSPLGGLDLAAATQPALDAAAAALGTGCGAAREVAVDLVDADLGGPFTVVPLLGGGRHRRRPPRLRRRCRRPSRLDAARRRACPSPSAPSSGRAPAATRGIEMLHGVDMEVTVELGRTRMTVRDLLALSPGAVLELDRAAGSPADLLVNGRLIARGEVVVVDEDFGLRVTEIIDESAAG